MAEKRKVVLGKLVHHGEDCIAIRFAKDFYLNSAVKKVPGVKFSRTNSCWYVENSEGALSSILEKLMQKAWVDYSDLWEKEMQPLKRKLPAEYIEQLERMRYSENTKRIYTNYFAQFINYFSETAIDEIPDEQINRYMQYLLATKKIGSSAQNQAINAIKFYYEKVRKRERKVYALERPLKEMKLPKILSEEEVIAILKSVDNLKHKTMLSLIYAAGHRRSELINLEVNDIDSKRMVINIRGGKGKKDRITLLSDLSRSYFQTYRPKVWLFEGAAGEAYRFQVYRRYFRLH